MVVVEITYIHFDVHTLFSSYIIYTLNLQKRKEGVDYHSIFQPLICAPVGERKKKNEMKEIFFDNFHFSVS
jgi:hypothetical protein